MSALLLLAGASILGLTELPTQKLVPGRCVTFLWTRTETPVRLAMVDEGAQTIRLNKGRQMVDIAKAGPGRYGGHGYDITLSLDYVDRRGLANGSVVETGSMRIETPGQDALVLPVGGMRACS
jgi:hypothetical protein